MDELRIIKAVYFDPQIGPESGTDVTAELSAQIKNEALFYNGVYNLIFPDHFPRIYKRLKVNLEFKGRPFLKFYNENEKINLPDDIGKIQTTRWFETWWGKVVLGLVTAIFASFIVWYFGWN